MKLHSPKCDSNMCIKCIFTCDKCNTINCYEHGTECTSCGHYICFTCVKKRCEACGEVLCKECFDKDDNNGYCWTCSW